MQTSLTIGIVLGLAAGLAPGPLLALTITQSLKYGIVEGVKVAQRTVNPWLYSAVGSIPTQTTRNTLAWRKW